MSKTNIVVYTDGSCIGNGNVNANGGIGIYFPNKELKNVSKVYRHKRCTSSRTELYAILLAIKLIKQSYNLDDTTIDIYSDSKYSISCITKWAKNWEKNGWIKTDGLPVKNKEYICAIYKYFKLYNINFHHVHAHTKKSDEFSEYNDNADKLAKQATQRSIMENKKNKNQTKSRTRYDDDVEIVLVGID